MTGGRVEIDVLLLDAVARDLTAYAGEVSALQQRASGLQAGHLTSRLGAGGEWAQQSAGDVRERAELLRTIDGASLDVLRSLGISVLEVAGAVGPVPDYLVLAAHVGQLRDAAGAPMDLGKRPGESLDDWFDRLVTHSLDQVPLLQGLGAPLVEALSWYQDYGNLLVASGAVTNAAWRLTRFAAAPRLAALLGTAADSRLPAFVHGLLSTRVRNYGVITAPQSVLSVGYRGAEAINRLIALERTAGMAPWLQRAGTLTGNLFGRPLVALDGTVTTLRGASNLISVAQGAAPGTRLAAVARTGGAFRMLGVAGAGASTLFSAANVISQGNPVDAFHREGAGYVADVAETAFNASLTATLIAPNPWTLGATAVTGAIWAGAEIVDHWDDITAAADVATDWAGDRLDDAQEAVTDFAGDAVDAVAESPVNPMNWF